MRDFITDEAVRATPEERDAVQVFARRLVEDYGYPKDCVQTHPQARVRARPSDRRRTYPVDVAVFSDSRKGEADLYLVVECKKKKRKDGVDQLKLYMDMSPATIGVWFNGDEHVYLRKVLHTDGTRDYEELPNIPRYGQGVEDIGKFKRAELKKPSNLKAIFRDLRNYLATNARSVTRDEPLARELINILFCKIFDEVYTGPDEAVRFRSGHDEKPEGVAKRIGSLFDEVKLEYSDVFSSQDTIELDNASLSYVVGELQNYAVTEADRDAVGDAFEVFIGPALRGSEGQFFTPRNVVRLMVALVDPKPTDMVLDPAAGSGGFLIVALQHVWSAIEQEGAARNLSEMAIERRKRTIATANFRGLEKDAFLARVTKAYMAIIGDGRGGVFSDNSIGPPGSWHRDVRESINPGEIDVILTNPPFGAKLAIEDATTLVQYELAEKWQKSKETGEFEKTGKRHRSRPPQLLFLERCLQLLRPGGRMAIIVPESILGNPSYEYVLDWLFRRVKIRAVVTMPESLFKTSGKGGTHTKVAVLYLENTPPTKDYEIFMGDARWCGHDSRGNPTYRHDEEGNRILLDDVPLVAKRYSEIVRERLVVDRDHLGFLLKASEIQNRILVPKYYNPELDYDLEALKSTYELPRLSQLVEDGLVSITTGVEVGKMAYGTGEVPFVRTSDIANWELKIDPKQAVSEEIFKKYSSKCDVTAGDILMVRDGTYLIGTSAMVTRFDGDMLFQSHVYRIRGERPEELSPYLLLAALNSPVVKRQIRSKQFTQDIIDTLGSRVLELRIPIPKDAARRETIVDTTKRIVESRARLRQEAKELAVSIGEGVGLVEDEDVTVM